MLKKDHDLVHNNKSPQISSITKNLMQFRQQRKQPAATLQSSSLTT